MGFCKATSKFVVEWWTLDQTGCVCLIDTCSLKYTYTSSLKIGGDKKHSGEHELRLYNFGANPANRRKIDNLGTKWIIWIISKLFYSFQNLLNAVRYSVFDPFAYGRSLFISPLSNQQTSWGAFDSSKCRKTFLLPQVLASQLALSTDRLALLGWLEQQSQHQIWSYHKSLTDGEHTFHLSQVTSVI